MTGIKISGNREYWIQVPPADLPEAFQTGKTDGRNSLMCTCITCENGAFYFGRNLDLDVSFGEHVVITPRRFPLHFTRLPVLNEHYAMTGMAAAPEEFPLYAEAVNEKGLCMAGLNFPDNAVYQKEKKGMFNPASFELIPWILGRCSSVEEAEALLKNTNITADAFSLAMPPAPLHWMLADRCRCLVLEPVGTGLNILENSIGVLTNNPPFEYHRWNLSQYMNLQAAPAVNRFAGGLKLKPCSQGVGAAGLPGDASSVSRFVRAAFLKWNSVSGRAERENVSQFFHILDAVSMVRGSVLTPQGTWDVTTYSCCINAGSGVYYYKTYEDSRIRKVDMMAGELSGSALITETDGKIEIFESE